jgi:NitT/TauT family transport system substrate-binding protein
MRRASAVAALTAYALTARHAAAQGAATTVHVGSTLADDTVPIVVAQRNGYFARNGLDVQLMPAPSGAAVTSAVLSGSYEFGKSSLVALLAAHLRGLPVTIIAADAVNDPRAPYGAICVAADSAIATGKDFNGKTISVPSLNDLNTIAISSWIDKHGGDSSTVKFVEIPTSAAGVAVAEHRVDGAGIQQPALADALASGKVKSLGYHYDAISPDFYITVFFTTTDYAAKHPEVVRGFARAVSEAAAYQNTHHAETAPYAAELTKIALPVVEKMTRVVIGTQLKASEIQPMIDAAVTYKMIPRGFPARELIYSAP